MKKTNKEWLRAIKPLKKIFEVNIAQCTAFFNKLAEKDTNVKVAMKGK